jgi:hypothetical protein
MRNDQQQLATPGSPSVEYHSEVEARMPLLHAKHVQDKVETGAGKGWMGSFSKGEFVHSFGLSRFRFGTAAAGRRTARWIRLVACEDLQWKADGTWAMRWGVRIIETQGCWLSRPRSQEMLLLDIVSRLKAYYA